MSVSRLLITFGVVLIAVGLLWRLSANSASGRLPGDIVIERDNFHLYIPFATSLLVRSVPDFILWLVSR